MVGRPISWQIVLADLSLILFLTTLAGMTQLQKQDQYAATSQPIETTPQAIYRANPQDVPLSDWIALQGLDQRAQLTIHARHVSGQRDAAATPAFALAQEAERAGIEARVIFSPDREPDLWVVVAFDRSDQLAERTR